MTHDDSLGPDFSFELAAKAQGFSRACGIDEAGRGPLAGPVVAAAVILDPDNIPRGLNDSKKLDAETREALFAQIVKSAKIGVGIGDESRIDRDNILAATMWAMAEAVQNLSDAPHYALVDGNRAPKLSCGVQTIVAGDARSLSIAAASIIAKVTRDRIMVALHDEFPGYGFARHKGYGTAFHRAALLELGPCIHHRRSFAPVAQLLAR
ncbi:MAG: ribonuclease HII [Hyphomicrobiales bacterium]|nr:ribonuclease HII [Hyphomicrobiales bacterium]